MSRNAHIESARLAVRGVCLLLHGLTLTGPADVLAFAIRRLCEAVEHLADALDAKVQS